MASKNKKKSQFKWTKEFIILISSILVLVALAVVLNLPSSAERRTNKINDAISAYNTENETSYSTLTVENVYKDITHDNLASKKAQDAYTYVLYGSYTDGTFLDELYKINLAAKNYDIELIYICDSAWYVDEEDKDTLDFRNTVKEKMNALNNKKDETKNQDDFDVTLGTALLVFKADNLVFNSQTYSKSESSAEYNWDQFVNKALTLGKEEN